MLWGRREDWHNRRWKQPTGCPMPKPNDLSRSLATFEQESTLVVVIEMSQSSWLVAAIVPGVDREPLKKLEPDAGARCGSLCHPSDQCGRLARASASQDGSVGHRFAQASLPRLAARRAQALQHGGYSDAGRRGAKRPNREHESLVGERTRI